MASIDGLALISPEPNGPINLEIAFEVPFEYSTIPDHSDESPATS